MTARRPNGTPHHPTRAIRVSDELWQAVKDKAAERGETVAEAIRRKLTEYTQERNTQ